MQSIVLSIGYVLSQNELCSVATTDVTMAVRADNALTNHFVQRLTLAVMTKQTPKSH